MKVPDYMDSAHEAVDLIRARLGVIFGYNYHVGIDLPEVGDDVGMLSVLVTSEASRSSPSRHKEANLRLCFKLNLLDASGSQKPKNHFEFKVTEMSMAVANLGLKFKAFEGRSPLSAATSLVHWFETNQDKLTSLGSRK